MKKTAFILFFCVTTFSNSFSQDAKFYYEQAMEKVNAGNLDEGIKLFDKSIDLNPTNYISWFNRGMTKYFLKDYEGALVEYEQTLVLYPEYKNGYLSKGLVKKNLTNYDGALKDFTSAIDIDPNYSDAYFNRGMVYEMLNKKDSACIDFKRAKENGAKYADRKIEKCKENTPHSNIYFSILRLTKYAETDKYGFTEKDPIKVGIGPNGGPANQRAFLELLRDKQGKSLKFNRLGSCCMYDSKNAIFGKGMLDKYEITYRNDKDEELKAILFISFDDYEELKIPFGFKTIDIK